MPREMQPVEVLQTALASDLVDEDYEPYDIQVERGLSEDEIATFEARIGFTLPTPTRDLLTMTRGLTGGPLEMLEFASTDEYVSVDGFGFGASTIGFAADGFGNYWAYVLGSQSTDLGPIYFLCHDAPVFLYQSPDLAHFLVEMFKMCSHPFESLMDDVHEDRLKKVWRQNPDLIAVEEARRSGDETIAAFARSLPDRWKLIDLRNPDFGQGFSWGRCREIRRHERELVFGLDFKEPWSLRRWWDRLAGS